MSGLEVIGAFVSCVQLLSLVRQTTVHVRDITRKAKNFNKIATEFEGRLNRLERIVNLIKRVAEDIEYRDSSRSKDSSAKDAAFIIKESVVESQKTISNLLARFPQERGGFSIQVAVNCLCFSTYDIPIIEEGFKKIEGDIQYMSIALQCAQWDYHRRGHPHSSENDPMIYQDVLPPPYPEFNDDNQESETTGLENSIINDPGYQLDQLLVHQQDVDFVRQRFSHTLKRSIYMKDSRKVQELLKLGKDPLAQDSRGWCSLHHAAATNDKKITSLLLSKSLTSNSSLGMSPLEIRNKDGVTPLHLAASIGNLNMVKQLLDAGADKNGPDYHNRSPLFMAAEKNHRSVFELLLKHQAVATPHPSARVRELEAAVLSRHYGFHKKTDPVPALLVWAPVFTAAAPYHRQLFS